MLNREKIGFGIGKSEEFRFWKLKNLKIQILEVQNLKNQILEAEHLKNKIFGSSKSEFWKQSFTAICIHSLQNNRFTSKQSKPQPPCTQGTLHRRAATLHGKTDGFCSHSNAICNDRFKKRIELRTQKLAEHRGGTNSRIKRPQAQLRHAGGTFHRRLQPL